MISLITATYGRTKEIATLLESLSKQTYKEFEIVIIDQNVHDEVKSIVDNYKSIMKLYYIKSHVKGLSYNRNIGLLNCQSEIIGFPDDDCFYDDTVLENVVYQFTHDSSLKLLTFPVQDPVSSEIYRFGKGYFSRNMIFEKCISFNFFVRTTGTTPNVKFCEKLGVGAYWGAGEETDYLWELLNKKDKALFMAKPFIYHPKGDGTDCDKAYKYGLVFGAIYRKEIISRKNYTASLFFIYYSIKIIGAMILRHNKKFYYNSLKGGIKGFFSFR